MFSTFFFHIHVVDKNSGLSQLDSDACFVEYSMLIKLNIRQKNYRLRIFKLKIFEQSGAGLVQADNIILL